MTFHAKEQHLLICASSSSVATGAQGKGARPPTVDRHGHRIRANPRRFILGGSDSSSPDLLADGEGARCAVPPQKPHPRISPSGHVTSVPPTFVPGYATG